MLPKSFVLKLQIILQAKTFIRRREGMGGTVWLVVKATPKWLNFLINYRNKAGTRSVNRLELTKPKADDGDWVGLVAAGDVTSAGPGLGAVVVVAVTLDDGLAPGAAPAGNEVP